MLELTLSVPTRNDVSNLEMVEIGTLPGYLAILSLSLLLTWISTYANSDYSASLYNLSDIAFTLPPLSSIAENPSRMSRSEYVAQLLIYTADAENFLTFDQLSLLQNPRFHLCYTQGFVRPDFDSSPSAPRVVV